MYVVDTNVLIYAADTRAPEHRACRNLIEQSRDGHSPWYITWGIAYEFLRVVTHPRVFRNPMDMESGWSFIERLSVSPAFGILQETDRHVDIAREVLRNSSILSGNIVFDMHTAILMKENGISRIYTRDTDFHRFSFLDVIDPLTP